MATTRFMPVHVRKGWSMSRAIRRVIDYVENPEKTDSGRYISAYAFDEHTAAAEFYLSDQQYENLTGKRRFLILSSCVGQSIPFWKTSRKILKSS